MGRTVNCPAGQWTAIFDDAFVQIPWSWSVSFVTVDGSPLAGELVEKRSSWIFPNPPITLPLEPTMQFNRGWWNTFYSVRIKPTSAVVAHIE